jgi:hypothetical protein
MTNARTNRRLVEHFVDVRIFGYTTTVGGATICTFEVTQIGSCHIKNDKVFFERTVVASLFVELTYFASGIDWKMDVERIWSIQTQLSTLSGWLTSHELFSQSSHLF